MPVSVTSTGAESRPKVMGPSRGRGAALLTAVSAPDSLGAAVKPVWAAMTLAGSMDTTITTARSRERIFLFIALPP